MMEFLVAIATLVIAVFTALVWKISKRMEWLTAAMESHSETMLKIAAHKADIPMELWDPSIENFPRKYGHKEPYTLEKLYVGIHPSLRNNPPPSLCYQLGLFARDFWEKPRDCWDDFLRGKRQVIE